MHFLGDVRPKVKLPALKSYIADKIGLEPFFQWWRRIPPTGVTGRIDTSSLPVFLQDMGKDMKVSLLANTEVNDSRELILFIYLTDVVCRYRLTVGSLETVKNIYPKGEVLA